MVERATPKPDSGIVENYGSAGLGEDPSRGPMMIGGTHNVSVRIDPNRALTGGYTPIPGDTMPAGAPVDVEAGEPPYFPKN